jgi:hypothetical protein
MKDSILIFSTTLKTVTHESVCAYSFSLAVNYLSLEFPFSKSIPISSTRYGSRFYLDKGSPNGVKEFILEQMDNDRRKAGASLETQPAPSSWTVQTGNQSQSPASASSSSSYTSL